MLLFSVFSNFHKEGSFMKIKSINGVTRRRGTTIAAAALSVALVTPFVHPVVNPGASPVAAAQDAATAQDRSVDSKGTSEATAIRADGTWGQKKGYQGTVYLDRDSNLQDQDKADKAMSGVKVLGLTAIRGHVVGLPSV